MAKYLICYNDTEGNYSDEVVYEARTAQEAVNQFRSDLRFAGIEIFNVYREVKGWR